MLRNAGQTTGPIGLKFLWTLMGGRGVLKAKKIRIFFPFFLHFLKTFIFNFLFHGQRRALQLVYIINIVLINVILLL